MKVLNAVFVFALCVASTSAAITCISGKDGTAAGAECDGDQAAATVCHKPEFKEYTGYFTAYEFGCGPCNPVKAEECKECTPTSNTEACNTPEEVGEDFQCHSYKANADGDGYELEDDQVTCKRLKNTDIKCNMPTALVNSTGYTPGGCGPCTLGEKTAKKCAECDAASCNKADSDYQCYTWKWETDKWVQGVEKTCSRPTQGLPIVCNAPNYDKAKQTEYTSDDVCKACDSGEKAAENCLECDKEKCNNSPALAVSFILATMCAVMFAL